jgi:flagellar basal-body rod modification protein FlgD
MATIIDQVNNAPVYSGNTTATKSNTETSTSDRFLTLLVAQMENQDPLNPMDNAQVTSQMAQISTVSGIEKLNTTMEGLNTQYLQSQRVQGASLVGHDVMVAGNRLSIADDGHPQGVFELAGPADSVNVDILSAGGKVIDTVPMGTLTTGTQTFDWTPKSKADLQLADSFRVVAKTGAAVVGTTPLMRDRVDSVASGADGLTLQLSRLGNFTLDQVKSFN